MAGDRQRAIAAGADDYDTKPVDLERLLAKIAALTGAPS
jgi:DNA-binding response OmpR family regulator